MSYTPTMIVVNPHVTGRHGAVLGAFPDREGTVIIVRDAQCKAALDEALLAWAQAHRAPKDRLRKGDEHVHGEG